MLNANPGICAGNSGGSCCNERAPEGPRGGTGDSGAAAASERNGGPEWMGDGARTAPVVP